MNKVFKWIQKRKKEEEERKRKNEKDDHDEGDSSGNSSNRKGSKKIKKKKPGDIVWQKRELNILLYFPPDDEYNEALMFWVRQKNSS